MGGESTALANMVREGPSGEVSLGLRPECRKRAMGKFRGQASGRGNSNYKGPEPRMKSVS